MENTYLGRWSRSGRVEWRGFNGWDPVIVTVTITVIVTSTEKLLFISIPFEFAKPKWRNSPSLISCLPVPTKAQSINIINRVLLLKLKLKLKLKLDGVCDYQSGVRKILCLLKPMLMLIYRVRVSWSVKSEKIVADSCPVPVPVGVDIDVGKYLCMSRCETNSVSAELRSPIT